MNLNKVVKISFGIVTGLLVGTVLVACAKETSEALGSSEINITSEVVSEDLDYTYTPSFTDEEAQAFIDKYVDVSSAHIEVYNPVDYSMAYYDLTDEQVEKVKGMLEFATVDIEKDSSFADFTTTLHMFNENGDYVYVVALEADKTTMYCEPGELKCDNLADYMEVLAMNVKKEVLEDN